MNNDGDRIDLLTKTKCNIIECNKTEGLLCIKYLKYVNYYFLAPNLTNCFL